MKRRAALAALVAAVLLAGCSFQPTVEGMRIADPQPLARKDRTVQVFVEGGPETSSELTADAIANDDLRQAIEASILASGLFTEVVSDDGADYVLQTTLVSVRRPYIGASMTVAMEAIWSLTRRGAGDPVWRQTVPSSHAVGGGAAFAGGTRLRLATEGAVRKNVETALQAIAALEL